MDPSFAPANDARQSPPTPAGHRLKLGAGGYTWAVHSLKYVIGRHWARAHTTFLVCAAILIGIVIYLVTQ